MFPICYPWLSDSKTVFVFSLALRVKNQKIVGLLIFIAQKKGFDALNATQKTSALCTVQFMTKSSKTGLYGQKWSNWGCKILPSPEILGLERKQK